MAVPEEFTGRDGALAWLDAEHASLTAAVQDGGGHWPGPGRYEPSPAAGSVLAWRRRFDDLLATTIIGLDAGFAGLDDRGMARATALTNLGHRTMQEVRRFEEAITAHQGRRRLFSGRPATGTARATR